MQIEKGNNVENTINHILKSNTDITSEVDPNLKTSLIERLKNRDKPLLATPDAHGPG